MGVCLYFYSNGLIGWPIPSLYPFQKNSVNLEKFGNSVKTRPGPYKIPSTIFVICFASVTLSRRLISRPCVS
jgi:hypothetical protein